MDAARRGLSSVARTNQQRFTLAEYKEQINALAKSAEDMGYQVVVVRWTVERMREALQARGFENTTENRAVLISEAGADQEINNDEC